MSDDLELRLSQLTGRRSPARGWLVGLGAVMIALAAAGLVWALTQQQQVQDLLVQQVRAEADREIALLEDERDMFAIAATDAMYETAIIVADPASVIDEVAVLQQELAASDATIDSLRDQLSELDVARAQIAALEARNRDLATVAAEVAGANDQAAALRAEIARLSEAQAQVARLQAENRALDAELARSQGEVASLSAQIRSVRTNFEARIDQQESLIESLSERMTGAPTEVFDAAPLVVTPGQ